MSENLRRARTSEQKHFRRQQILKAAEVHFGEVGYEAFSMANLAKQAGVVKGTLYLYFKTREEVFLTLYNQSLNRWSEEFIEHLQPIMNDKEYASVLYETAMQDQLFVPLLGRLEQVIEHNVSIDSLIHSKRLFIRQVNYIAQTTSAILGLSTLGAQEVVRTMGVLLVGATRADQAPSLDAEDVPSDVRSLIDLFSSENLFISNACRIIAGIRSSDSLE
ncbi:MAG TPA: TetR/AcrR family transcriptional regulator [Porticoccaceae bacterium]|jgi:AcrR family transcriptional regulator|nr:TetR/AcrR family transcriptional regulator [Porticoccaceae bacterium]